MIKEARTSNNRSIGVGVSVYHDVPPLWIKLFNRHVGDW